MEFIKAILKEHVKEDGTLDVDAVMNVIDKEFPKNAVPKEVFNQTNEELKSTKAMVDELKTENGTVDDLKTKIADFEAENQRLKDEQLTERKTFAIKEALQKEGVSDIEYISYKLGEVETDDNGNLVGLDDKLNELKVAHPTFFGSEKKEEKDTKGYQTIDNKLDQGKEPDPEQAMAKEFSESLGLQN